MRPVGVAQQRVVVGDRRRALARAGQRVGQQRERGALGERGERRAEARVALERPATMTARGRAFSSSSQALDELRRGVSHGSAGRVTHGRPPSRPGTISTSGTPSPSGTSGSRSEKFRCTGPGPAVDRGPERAAGELAQPADAGGARGVVVDLEVPLGRAAVELDLVDRLPGADLAQLGRAVGGQHEQRHARLVRLDHRGRVVRGRGAGRAGERGGHARWSSPGRARRTRRSARRGATWRAAAARAPASARAASSASPGDVHGVAQPAADELVDEGAQAEIGVGSGHDAVCATRRSSSCTASRRPARAGGGRPGRWRDAIAR